MALSFLGLCFLGGNYLLAEQAKLEAAQNCASGMAHTEIDHLQQQTSAIATTDSRIHGMREANAYL